MCKCLWVCAFILNLLLIPFLISPSLSSVIQMKLIMISIVCAFLQVRTQNPKSHWTLLPNSAYDLCEKTLHTY